MIRVSSLIVGLLVSAAARGENWPQQMGPNRDGIVPIEVAGALAAQFADTRPPQLWQASVGFGSAPVVVQNGRIYTYGLFKPGTTPDGVSTAGAAPTLDEVVRVSRSLPEVGPMPANIDRSRALPNAVMTSDFPDAPKENGAWGAYRGNEYALCLDAETGKVIWATKLSDWGIAYLANVIWGPLASPLITLDGRLYIHSITGQLYAIDAATGKLIWHENLFHHKMCSWSEKTGNAAGPLLVRDTVIVAYVGRLGASTNRTCITLGGFDAATGQERWVTQAPFEGFRVMNCRFGFADIGGLPTVLAGGGGGTMGVDPASGKIRWSFPAPVDETGLPFPYGNYAPVVWKNYVIDAVSAAHDDFPSKTWCVKIDDDKPTLVWQTNEFVPHVEIGKSNLLVWEGKFYGFDAHGFWNHDKARPFRGKEVGQFQCRDVLTGRLLWSTNAFLPPDVDPHKWPGDWGSSKLILASDTLVVTNPWGLWIARLKLDGVEMLATIRLPSNHDHRKTLSEPVLVNGRLFIRQISADENYGLQYPLGKSAASLICFDLRPTTPK